MTQLLPEIGVPIIISQKTRNNGPKLIKYWPTEIQDANAGQMRPICRFQIVLRRRPDIIELSTKPRERSRSLILPRSNLIMLCELNQDGPMAETAE